jgi:hypothetical protein
LASTYPPKRTLTVKNNEDYIQIIDIKVLAFPTLVVYLKITYLYINNLNYTDLTKNLHSDGIFYESSLVGTSSIRGNERVRPCNPDHFDKSMGQIPKGKLIL